MENSWQERLLQSAKELLVKRRKEPSIKEVAERARAKESIVYRYFENKQDLLFRVIQRELMSLYEELNGGINGIVEPMSRLSRFVWLWLDQCEKKEWFFHFLYFSCLSKREFYQHEAFHVMRKCWETVDAILSEGVKMGVFSSDLSVGVARDMVMGLLDMECIYSLAFSPEGKPTDRFDDCYEIISRMFQPGQMNPVGDDDKERIILDAVERVVGGGKSERVTTAIIAKEAGVSEGTIYKYFRDKEGLFLSAIRRRLELLSAMTEDFFKSSSPISKLIRFIFYHFTVYMRYPFAVQTFVLKGIYCEEFYASEAVKEYERYLGIVDEIMAEGKRERIVSPTVNEVVLKRMMTGFFARTAQLWFYRQKDVEKEILSRLHQAISLILKVVLPEARRPRWLEPEDRN